VINLIVKNPGATHESTVRRDDSMHDENEFQYRQIWIPLVDTTEQNGALYVVPRSHKFFTEQRPQLALWPYRHLTNRLNREIVPLYVKAGDMIIYLDKTLHGSPNNYTNEPRPVVQGGLMHTDATPTFTRYIEESNEVVSYAADVDFYLNKEYLKPVIDSKYRFLSRKKYAPIEITEADVDRFFAPAH
jgi:ectoine hydroxylase-related dioxygenase (phytanoyl-CoA dioxygenase family)